MTEPAVWDDDNAAVLVGSVVLVGLTRKRPGGDEHEQMWGVVVEVDGKRGVCLALSGTREGETYWLPPDLRAVSPAQPGTYRLRGTGEEVVDPDFVATWTVTLPAN